MIETHLAVPQLSAEQQCLLADETCVAEAGPGSGKTRTLVARFVHRARTSAQGVALLSFTNAAVDEARARCASRPELLRAPHFVGTIDSFFNRFIVTPAEASRLHHPPTYLASWDDLPDAFSMVRLNSVPGHGMRLSAFTMDGDGELHLNEGALWREERPWHGLVRSVGKEGALFNVAKGRISSLVKRGIYDTPSARVKALGVPIGPERPCSP